MRVLEQHVPTDAIVARAVPLEGMLLTGPGGVAVRGHYPAGLRGRALSRLDLDRHLVDQAIAAGVAFADGVNVIEPLTDSRGEVAGVRARTSSGRPAEHRAAMVLAADGRESRLARHFGLVRQPVAPRRWAVGAYFAGVSGLGPVGEMHVRRGHYIGVAPMPDGLANACLVTPGPGAAWRDPASRLLDALRADEQLAPRFAEARLIGRAHVLGPMALDATGAGVAGMLLAGDAGGFVDPMTGDGLRFAIAGGALAASSILDVLSGRLDRAAAVDALTAVRHRLFAAKWRFNRVLRAIVSSASTVHASAVAARLAPPAFAAIIRYAGDCPPCEA
jgi:flavin-dependent dehydrogenase